MNRAMLVSLETGSQKTDTTEESPDSAGAAATVGLIAPRTPISFSAEVQSYLGGMNVVYPANHRWRMIHGAASDDLASIPTFPHAWCRLNKLNFIKSRAYRARRLGKTFSLSKGRLDKDDFHENSDTEPA